MPSRTAMLLIALLLFFLSMSAVRAQIPRTISYQGVLADASGNLLPDGNHALQLVLYDQEAGGNQVFIENQTVPVVHGVFNVILGSVNPFPPLLRFNRAYFLGVSVDGNSELTPRTPLTAMPYALQAERATVAESLSPDATGVVTGLNGRSGAITLQGIGNTTVSNIGNDFTISSPSGVSSVNNVQGAITLQGGGGTTVTNSGGAFTISSSGAGGSAITGLDNGDGTIDILNPGGPRTTINLKDSGIVRQKIAPQQVVKSLNNLADQVTLAAAGGATITTNGNTITINAGSGSGGTGIQGIQNTDNALEIANSNGPTATVNVRNQGITSAKIADGAVTAGKIPAGQVVKSLNKLEDDVTLSAGANITITPAGNTLTIASTAPGLLLPYVGSGSFTSGGFFSVTNSANPSGGQASYALYGYAPYGTGVFGTSNSGYGVQGYSSGGPGVEGESQSVSAVRGFGHANGASGVYGSNTSAQGIGVAGINLSTIAYGRLGDGEDGVTGHSPSATGNGVYGYNVSGGSAVYCAGKFHQGSGAFEAYPTSTTWVGAKPATVKLDDGRKVKLFAEEAAEVWFSDYGEGRLSGGRAHVDLDTAFLQTVTIDATHPMKVFVQLEDDCNGVFVANRSATGFDVVELRSGASGARFVYRVVCARKYYEGLRLASEEEEIRYNTRLLQNVWPEVLERERTIDAARNNSARDPGLREK